MGGGVTVVVLGGTSQGGGSLPRPNPTIGYICDLEMAEGAGRLGLLQNKELGLLAGSATQQLGMVVLREFR